MACALLLLGMVALVEEPEDRPSDETIEGWIADLTHPDLTRREAATSNLIAAGDVAAYRLWSRCDAADQGLALRARRVFGAVFGVSPEIYGEVKELVQSNTTTGDDLAARAQQVMEHGPAAVDLALRLLGPERKRRLAPLYTELVVRAALKDLAEGNDMHSAGHNAVVELSDQATPVLLRVLEDREGHGAHRVHVLWLYSTVTKLAERWRQWLVREVESFDAEAFPWLKDAIDAVRIVTSVREHVEDRFFYFDKRELVEVDSLNTAALAAMDEAFEGKDPVTMEGLDRQILESMLGSEREIKEATPEAVLSCLGACPFESEVSDLIRITNATGMIKSLGDRFSGLRLSNDPEGDVRPGWLPGLLDNSDESNGFMVSEKEDTIVVDFVLYDSPAFYAGIRPGDQLIQIADEFVSEMAKEDRNEKLQKEGTFTFLRDGWNRPYGFELEPAKVMVQHIVIKALLPGKIGYLRLKMFDLGCSVKMEHALRKAQHPSHRRGTGCAGAGAHPEGQRL